MFLSQSSDVSLGQSDDGGVGLSAKELDDHIVNLRCNLRSLTLENILETAQKLLLILHLRRECIRRDPRSGKYPRALVKVAPCRYRSWSTLLTKLCLPSNAIHSSRSLLLTYGPSSLCLDERGPLNRHLLK